MSKLTWAVQAQRNDELVPRRAWNFRHRLYDNADAAQTSVPDHVLENRIVNRHKLGHQ